jgi:hypothetical protein
VAAGETGARARGHHGVSGVRRTKIEGGKTMVEQFAITVLLGLVKTFIKNPKSAKAQRLKADLLAVRDGINSIYPGE